jgi:hypothetical protein
MYRAAADALTEAEKSPTVRVVLFGAAAGNEIADFAGVTTS